MSSTLPSRWQEILRREAAVNVRAVLAQAQDRQRGRPAPRWAVPALVIAVASLSLVGLIDGTEATGRGSLPFDRSTVLSTRTAGLGASAEDLAPRTAPVVTQPASAPVAQADVADHGERHGVARPDRRSSSPRQPADQTACPDCEKGRGDVDAAQEGVAAPPAGTTVPPVASLPEQLPTVVVNVGTRLEARLTDPIVTGAALAPVTAEVSRDIVVGERVAISAGTLLAGEGFSTEAGDRAQVVFTALVREGKTHPFEGWALQEGESGVKGKVVRKGSRGKRGAGAVLGAAASVLTFGLAGSASGAEGAALGALGNTAATDLAGLGRDWRRSDKVVRVEAGAVVTVYLRRDLILE